MKLLQYLIICILLFILPQVIFGETKDNGTYSDEEMNKINHILIIKKACDLHIPEYYLNTMEVYARWREKHNSIIQDIENHPAYINELGEFRNKLNLMTPQQLSETLMSCKKISDRLNKGDEAGPK
ncbi:MAG: hypothetical protein GXP19_08720 [Gammaproteobacteria bacterium]|nr:hypothetical protein [Gammaproteobacteria bacterium]